LWLRRIVFQRHANLADGGIDAHFDITGYVFSRERTGDLLSPSAVRHDSRLGSSGRPSSCTGSPARKSWKRPKSNPNCPKRAFFSPSPSDVKPAGRPPVR
jgi:hypothetical protein